MPTTVNNTAAVSSISAVLAPHVTNGIIDGLAKALGVRGRLPGSNKMQKIYVLIDSFLSDGRSRTRTAEVIASLVMEAHHRTLAGSAEMTESNVDAVVDSMRALRLPTGELGNRSWRKGLRMGDAVRARNAAPLAGSSRADPWAPAATDLPRPQRHEKALAYMAQLTQMAGVTPQERGRELEKVLEDVLKAERLRPRRNIVNPGEQIDVAFAIRESYYLLECRWHSEPQGLPAVREFSSKVARKAEGAFGVLLSMSGFVPNINETATQGSRLNCVGITGRELWAVLEGRCSFADIVQAARYEATTRPVFYDPI